MPERALSPHELAVARLKLAAELLDLVRDDATSPDVKACVMLAKAALRKVHSALPPQRKRRKKEATSAQTT